MSDLSRLTGVGPKRERLLAEAGIRTLRDLVYHLPRRYMDRTRFTPIRDLRAGVDAIFPAKVSSISMVQTRMLVEVEDGTGGIELVFFNGAKYLSRRFYEGQRLLVAGVPTYFRDLQLAHPEFEAIGEGFVFKGEILPRYPLTQAMAEAHMEHRFLQRIALEALDIFSFTDSVDAAHREALGLLPEAALLRSLHRLPALEDLPALRRQLKVRELLPLSMRLETMRRGRQTVGRAWEPSKSLAEKLRAGLPFALTPGQNQAVREIADRQATPGQFCGLLQGDVGAGKTVVAMLTAANVLEAGGQAALMAPTEILAYQHYQTLSPWLAAAGVRCGLLTGDMPKSGRDALLAGLQSGGIGFVAGTHALYSPDVAFQKLGYVVVDEQHRFGVQQRQALAEKSEHPDILYMSATPIPRTLAHTVYGDLEIFALHDKPAGRLPVKTRLVPPAKRNDMLAFLLKEALSGNQVFWVVPQIGKGDPLISAGVRLGEEDGGGTMDDKPNPERPRKGKNDRDPDIFEPARNPVEDLATLDRVRAELSGFSRQWKVGVVHGRLKAEGKEDALDAFRKGETQVLLATTVIEVGVDVPQANLMVIEAPDRFGLAQLHQLRGRTGRGSQQAWCFLALPERPLPPDTLERLSAFTETLDGFRIAEMDLRARGAGDLDGKDQSGYGDLRFTDLIDDFDLVREMRRYAQGALPKP